MGEDGESVNVDNDEVGASSFSSLSRLAGLGFLSPFDMMRGKLQPALVRR